MRCRGALHMQRHPERAMEYGRQRLKQPERRYSQQRNRRDGAVES